MMLKGSIKKVVRDRGFGFIAAADGSEYFFHRSATDHDGRGFDTLQEGDAVQFTREESNKGPRAAEIRLDK